MRLRLRWRRLFRINTLEAAAARRSIKLSAAGFLFGFFFYYYFPCGMPHQLRSTEPNPTQLNSTQVAIMPLRRRSENEPEMPRAQDEEGVGADRASRHTTFNCFSNLLITWKKCVCARPFSSIDGLREFMTSFPQQIFCSCHQQFAVLNYELRVSLSGSRHLMSCTHKLLGCREPLIRLFILPRFSPGESRIIDPLRVLF